MSTNAPSSHAATSPSSLARRLLPTPASATSSTRCARSRVVAIFVRPRSVASSASRPTSGDRSRTRRRPGGVSALDGAERLDRLVAAPERRPARAARSEIASRVASSVAGPTTTWPGAPSFSSRWAVFTTSPIAVGSPPARIAPTSTSPLFTPMRTCTGISISAATRLHRLLHAERGPHRSLGVVLVGDRARRTGR